MQFDEKKFKDDLLSNPKIENRYLEIKKEIEEKHIIMLESKPTIFERLNNLFSSRAFKYGLATSGAFVLISGITLGILLPKMFGEPFDPDANAKFPPLFLGVSLKEVPVSEINELNLINFSENNENNSEPILEKDSVIVLDLSFENPDEFEINSFKVSQSGAETLFFTTADYLEGSNFTHIYVNAGTMSDEEINLNVNSITYLDSGVEKSVGIKGNSSLTILPAPVEPPVIEETYEFTFENSEIYSDSASFLFQINDEYNMLSNLKAILYKDNNVVESLKLEKTESLEVSFSNLSYDSSYRYEIKSDVKKEGVTTSEVLLFENEFNTKKYFDEITLTPSYENVEVEIKNKISEASLDEVRLLDSEDQEISKLGKQEDSFNVNDLLTNKNYKLEFTFTENGKHIYKEIKEFKTLSYEAPQIEITYLEVTGRTVDFDYEANDPNSLGEFSKIELYLNGILDREANAPTTMFTDLEVASDYELRVYYTYDLKDGNGPQTIFASEEFNSGVSDVSIRDVVVDTNLQVKAPITIRITVNNLSNLNITHFVINGIKYEATKTSSVGGEYQVILDPVDTNGDHFYTITAYYYSMNGDSGEVPLEASKFKVTIY